MGPDVEKYGDSEQKSGGEPGRVDPLVMSLNYRETMWAEMKPDLYDGETCDQVRPVFECSTDGDMDSETMETLTLKAEHFPPGTKVIVSLPVCPKCSEYDADLAVDGKCPCGFNWNEWRDHKYS